jgi:hypothetical protein
MTRRRYARRLEQLLWLRVGVPELRVASFRKTL